jgi:hypothetical protein
MAENVFCTFYLIDDRKRMRKSREKNLNCRRETRKLEVIKPDLYNLHFVNAFLASEILNSALEIMFQNVKLQG